MKKNIFLGFLALALLFMPSLGFAAQADVKGTTDKALAASESKKNSGAKGGDFFASETKPAPVVTISTTKKNESVAPAATIKTENVTPVVKAQTENIAPDVKTKTDKKENVAPKASSEVFEEKVSKATDKTETSKALNSAEMQKRWKALFSKEITPDSLSYTVKSDDSLYVIARKNHTTVDFIKKINDLKSNDIYPRMKLKIHTAPFSILLDKSKNILVLSSNGEPVKKYSVATGKKNCTPVGEFKITDKLVNPTWFKTGAILPPGSPENALGTRWMGFDKPAYGIHGTIEPKSIGTQASEGCIRMLNEDVEELYSIVPVGTKVTIQD